MTATAAAQVTATVWVAAGMHRAHGMRLPLADLARIAAAGVLTLAVTWSLAGDYHHPLRMVGAAAAGFLVFLLTCVAARLIGQREWGLLTTSPRRLLAMRASGVTP